MNGQKIMLNHTSRLFRDPKLLGTLVLRLRDYFPKGVPIEIYAGSHGEDALSTAMCLHDAFGNRAISYPITVSDLCPENFERSRQGIIASIPLDVSKNGEPKGESWSWLNIMWNKARTHSGNLLKTPLERFIDTEPLNEEHYGHFLVQHDPCSKDYSNWCDSKVFYEELYRLKPEMKAIMERLIYFESQPVDVVNALTQKPENTSRPRVVMLRNMVYLLSKSQRLQLLQALKDNLPLGSLLCIGEEEYGDYSQGTEFSNHDRYKHQEFPKRLPKAGFEVDSRNPCIWRKVR